MENTERAGLRLEGRAAIVTGAGQGLGQGIAEALADEGAVVALFGRTMNKVQTVADAITARGGRAIAVRCDVGEKDEVDAAVSATINELGRLDILVNCAQGGNLNVVQPTAHVTEADVWESFRTGPIATLHMMQACFEALRESGRGAVVNLGSGVGVRGGAGLAGYAMAKEAINGLTKVTANEWGRDQIRVNLVCPSGMSPAAETYRDEDPARWEKHLRGTPLGRFGDAYDDIGRAVVALVSDDLKYLTGATLMLDGGQVMLR